MGWLLDCFKCSGKFEELKRKKRLSGRHHLVPGRSNLAAVAHATSPEDVRVVRNSHPPKSQKERHEKGSSEFFASPAQDELKTRKSAKHFAEQIEDRSKSHNHDLDSDFRERLLQDASAAKELTDEFKFVSRCFSLYESSSDATYDKPSQDSIEQVDCWSASSHVITSQPDGLVLRGKSIPRRNVNNGVERNALNCAIVDGLCESLLIAQNRLHGGKNPRSPVRYVQSPPWLFSTAKAQEQSFCTDDFSEDLLMEHLDLASLIQDSALVTDWELSSGSSFADTLGLSDQNLSQEQSVETSALFRKSSLLEQKNMRHSENRFDRSIVDLNSNSRVRTACTDDEPDLCKKYIMGVNEMVDAEETCSNKDVDYLFRPEICAATEESDSACSFQKCFSSQLELLKCNLSYATENLYDRESTTGDFVPHKNFSEVPMESTHPEMEPLQEPKDWEDEYYPLLSVMMKSNYASHNDKAVNLVGADSDVNTDVDYPNTSSSKASVQQDTEGDLWMEEQFDMKDGDGNLRKKTKISDCSSFVGTDKGTLAAEFEKKGLLDVSTTADGVQSGSELTEEVLSRQERSSSSFVEDGSCSNTSKIFPSPSHLETSPSVTSYRSPARLADDRPIIGTVAAHWSPITTRKWWDGKGIPNSTSKYQEDQKVNWHAIPFEVRLEQALAKQNLVR